MPYVVFIIGTLCALGGANERLLLRAGSHRVLTLPGIKRVAVASQKIVRVKALPPEQLLLTAKKIGQTTVTIWDARGHHSLDVRVTSEEAYAGSEDFPLVRVSLEFLEMERHFLRELGLEWPTQTAFGLNAGLQGPPWGVNYSGSFGSLSGLLKTLVHEGWASLMAKPELFVRLGEQASFHAGGELPVAGTTGSNGNYYSRIAWKPYGLSVKVLPRRRQWDQLQCEIEMEVSELGAEVLENIPSLSRRHLQTRVDLLDGETIVLSGLSKKGAETQEGGLPGLSGVPLLGSLLFGNQKQRRRETEMLMALTVSLVHRQESRQRLRRMRERIDGTP